MEEKWYYVEAGERRGPIEFSALQDMVKQGALTDEDYVWRKGFENWVRVKDVADLQSAATPETKEAATEMPGVIEEVELNLQNLAGQENSIFIKIGADRGANEVEYGPYSLEIIKKLFSENRINAKTFLFIRGMQDWAMVADFEDYSEVFEDTPPVIKEAERRSNQRKPFVARMYMESQQQVYLGVCRDISVGGMQVLVDHFPAKIGESISINVHPENTDHHFVAGGQIVRMLEGGLGFSFRFTDLGADAKQAIEKYLTHE